MGTQLYGLLWPTGINPPSIELKCYREYESLSRIPGVSLLKKWEHLRRAIEYLWPEILPNGKRGFCQNKWFDVCCRAWCEGDFMTFWGPTSSGKSTNLGIIILAHWLAAPDKTTCIVCSTTMDMLEKRVFGKIIEYHQMYAGKLPGTYLKTKHQIVMGDE